MEKTKCPNCMADIEPQNEQCPQCGEALDMETQTEPLADSEVKPEAETASEYYDNLLELAKERAEKSALILNLCILPFYAIPVALTAWYIFDEISHPKRAILYCIITAAYFIITGIWKLIHKKAMRHYTKVHYKEMINN